MASRQILRRSADILRASSARVPAFRQAASALLHAQPSAQYATSSPPASASPAVPSASVSARVPFGSHVSAASFQRRGFAITATEDLVKLPRVNDPSALSTLKEALATGWVPCDSSLIAKIDKTIKSTDDAVAKEALSALKAAAEAVEVFGEKLELLRLELDELSGGKFGGEAVGKIPEDIRVALSSALRRYSAYLEAFGADEGWLQRKVKEELGAVLITVKQRCSGLEDEWNQISLLGTSGLVHLLLVNSLPRHGGRPNFNDWVKSYRPDLASHQFDPIRIRAPRQIPEEYRDVHIPSEEELQMLAQFGHAHHASYYFNTKPAAAMAAAAEAAAGVGVGDQKP
ncbi:unnamed protein product [Closterium sp. NIES-65]|nr:unnamed protein product [Closterium sp. NIES-65]